MKKINKTHIKNSKDNCILFCHKEDDVTKYISKDNGVFKIWTNKSSNERTAKDIKTAVTYYNNPEKFVKKYHGVN
jgi:hypothetical protein